jgi:GTP1/Obg family GTP-binding protein
LQIHSSRWLSIQRKSDRAEAQPETEMTETPTTGLIGAFAQLPSVKDMESCLQTYAKRIKYIEPSTEFNVNKKEQLRDVAKTEIQLMISCFLYPMQRVVSAAPALNTLHSFERELLELTLDSLPKPVRYTRVVVNARKCVNRLNQCIERHSSVLLKAKSSREIQLAKEEANKDIKETFIASQADMQALSDMFLTLRVSLNAVHGMECCQFLFPFSLSNQIIYIFQCQCQCQCQFNSISI